MNGPCIHKVGRIKGKTLVLRNATISDAAFILSLRTDQQKSKHLSKVDDNLSAQVAWLQKYEERDAEAYFIIENAHGAPLGTVRLYDAQGDSFCWGSWVLVHEAPSTAAIESALMIYTYALEFLGFARAHFQVHKANESVWKFHERFGAKRIAEDAVQYEYTLSNADIHSSMNRYRRYLPHGIVIEESF